MNKLKYVNRLTEDEIDKFLKSIGYELNKNMVNERTGESVSCLTKCENLIICRCTKTQEIEEEKLYSKFLSKFSSTLGIYSAVLSSATTIGNTNCELIILRDFDCYKGLSLSKDDEELANTFTEKLWSFLHKKFGIVYEIDLVDNLEENKNNKEKEL